MRNTIIAGNWKMNSDKNFIDEFFKELLLGKPSFTAEIVICPPFPYLLHIAKKTKDIAIKLGAQSCNANHNGAHTGEVSVEMLSDFGVKYVIVGHSERRALYAEDDLMVAKKVGAVVNANMKAILCVGETQEEKDAGKTKGVIKNQIDSVLNFLGAKSFSGSVIAYEPVWAIGTGITPTAEKAQEIHSFIRELLADYDKELAKNTAILYGGSMNINNAKDFIGCEDIDGGLIGGASLKASDFLKICKAV